MKIFKHILGIACFSALFASCAVDGEDIGAPLEITPEYNLDEGKASDADKARIKQIHEKYGSYIIYNGTEKDAFWKLYTGNANNTLIPHITNGDPANVGKMLDYLNDIWFKYFDDDFLKNGGMPYRLFIVDEYYTYRDYGDGTGMKIAADYLINSEGHAIIMGGMNTVEGMSEADKATKRAAFISDLLTYYLNSGIMTFPQEFYDVTDYTTEPKFTETESYGYISYTLDQNDALDRGFLPSLYISQWGTSVSWWIYKYSSGYSTFGSTSVENLMANDRGYYMKMILNMDDEAMQPYLEHELVNKKWNIILDHFKKNYKLDLRAFAQK